MPKRTTLPKDFAEQLPAASLDDLVAVFDRCELDARVRPGGMTAIGLIDCPDGLIEWLVGQGLDVDAGDSYDTSPLWLRASRGRPEQIPLLLSLGADIEHQRASSGTPLHGAAGYQRVDSVRVLLAHGADVNAVNASGHTPLAFGLRRTRNITIPAMAQIATLLIDAGATVSDDLSVQVERIGKDFEFHRANLSTEFLTKTEEGLTALYELFGATPAARRQLHDGSSPITVPAGSWQDQHQALWDFLVPSGGAAATVQGEVIRVTGRLAHEILDNGGANWDKDFRTMLKAVPKYFAQGESLPSEAIREARSSARRLRSGQGDQDTVYTLSRLAVSWVSANPTPIRLSPPSYYR
ncbi:ankyrin repeat domain-containing protein [Ornithinicoccus hortensis]|uniref:Ankyrin repeat protein n=1 Tax=Ornithinicoccus hortensis TaxID=82346 RepID=A0A542YTK4_9MICO|nr:ankyrin repeat domain-containing protein [Ornithinicoccus hortensis]TQL51381.1 ankyrin repeat protein [Ornithinicoccus hortensis]